MDWSTLTADPWAGTDADEWAGLTLDGPAPALSLSGPFPRGVTRGILRGVA